MLAERTKGITSFIVMDILEKALEMERRGETIIHLEIGEPDLRPPPQVVEAICGAVQRGETHYTHSLGIYPLREEIAADYERRYGVSVDPERVIVTVGTSGAFTLLFGVLLDPGAPILLADPGYPCYPNFARLVGARPVPVPVVADNGFMMTPAGALERGAPGDLVLLSSPANPTGTVTPRKIYRGLLDAGFNLISDEIYHGLTYGDAEEFTALEISDRAIVVNGFSKRYAMTGMRLGWMVVPPELVRPINRLAQNLFISAPTPSQYGGIAALREGEAWVRATREMYAGRRRLLLDILSSLGLKVEREPEGAFYVFADVSGYGLDSFTFCQRLLEEAGVAATPGRDFGAHLTERFVRFAYTNESEKIAAAGERMRAWLEGL